MARIGKDQKGQYFLVVGRRPHLHRVPLPGETEVRPLTRDEALRGMAKLANDGDAEAIAMGRKGRRSARAKELLRIGRLTAEERAAFRSRGVREALERGRSDALADALASEERALELESTRKGKAPEQLEDLATEVGRLRERARSMRAHAAKCTDDLAKLAGEG